jgi:hypothetical protein
VRDKENCKGERERKEKRGKMRKTKEKREGKCERVRKREEM